MAATSPEPTGSTSPEPTGSARTRTGIWIAVTVLLAAALIGTLWVPFYNHLTPALRGFPFFYWYQLMWVPIVAILSGAAYLLSKVARRGSGPAGRGREAGPGRPGGAR